VFQNSQHIQAKGIVYTQLFTLISNDVTKPTVHNSSQFRE